MRYLIAIVILACALPVEASRIFQPSELVLIERKIDKHEDRLDRLDQRMERIEQAVAEISAMFIAQQQREKQREKPRRIPTPEIPERLAAVPERAEPQVIRQPPVESVTYQPARPAQPAVQFIQQPARFIRRACRGCCN